MSLDQVQALQSMRNSWHNQHWPTEVGKCALSEVLVPKWLYGYMPCCVLFVISNQEGHYSSTEMFRSDSGQLKI